MRDIISVALNTDRMILEDLNLRYVRLVRCVRRHDLFLRQCHVRQSMTMTSMTDTNVATKERRRGVMSENRMTGTLHVAQMKIPVEQYGKFDIASINSF